MRPLILPQSTQLTATQPLCSIGAFEQGNFRMVEYFGDWLSLIGLILTLLGAWSAAIAGIISEADAIHDGITRSEPNTLLEQRQTPKVQRKIAARERVKCGLIAVAIGTALQNHSRCSAHPISQHY